MKSGMTVRTFAAYHGLTAQVDRLRHGGLSAQQIQLVLDCPVEWSSKLVGTLGFAFRHGLIRLNDLMLPDRPHEAELPNTFLHEVAHIAAELANPGDAHGYYWGHFMILFGLKPQRCHTVPATQLKAARAASKPQELTLDDF